MFPEMSEKVTVVVYLSYSHTEETGVPGNV